MLSVKLVRSLVLGETISNPFQSHPINPTQISINHDTDLDLDNGIDHHHDFHKGKKKLPILLFTPTKELISDTFRLATIARDIGMDFQPNSSLSHLLFSWPSPPSSSSYPSSSMASNYRTSVSSNTSTFTTTSSSTAATTSSTLQNDAVPIPFPSLSTTTSLSLLRSFISLSKGLFKLVFLNITPNNNPSYYNYYHNLINYGCDYDFGLFSRVSGRRVRTMDELSRELAGKGWAIFRTAEKRQVWPLSAEVEVAGKAALLEDSVYLFRKVDSNRVRAKGLGNGGEGRVRELRLPAVDFGKAVNLRVLLYILLMTDDVFYLA